MWARQEKRRQGSVMSEDSLFRDRSPTSWRISKHRGSDSKLTSRVVVVRHTTAVKSRRPRSLFRASRIGENPLLLRRFTAKYCHYVGILRDIEGCRGLQVTVVFTVDMKSSREIAGFVISRSPVRIRVLAVLNTNELRQKPPWGKIALCSCYAFLRRKYPSPGDNSPAKTRKYRSTPILHCEPWCARFFMAIERNALSFQSP